MAWTLTYDWWAQNKPHTLGRTGMGAALKAYSAAEKAFFNVLTTASATDAAAYGAYRTAWTALDKVEDCRLTAVGQSALAQMGFGPLLKPQVIITRQQRLRDAMAGFVADGPGGINEIMDLSQSCHDTMCSHASMVSRFERAQMSAAICKIPAAVRRLRELRADIETAMKSGLIAPEEVIERSGRLHALLKRLPGDFSGHLKALAMLRTTGLKLGHQKKPLWDWMKRADAVLDEAY
ncbi:hypothetical protein LA6_004935 [Marinibacterium anthonyi]|nr:hypothetical protein LA6_004935 [Marinibacterium anthonyi]